MDEFFDALSTQSVLSSRHSSMADSLLLGTAEGPIPSAALHTLAESIRQVGAKKLLRIVHWCCCSTTALMRGALLVQTNATNAGDWNVRIGTPRLEVSISYPDIGGRLCLETDDLHAQFQVCMRSLPVARAERGRGAWCMLTLAHNDCCVCSGRMATWTSAAQRKGWGSTSTSLWRMLALQTSSLLWKRCCCPRYFPGGQPASTPRHAMLVRTYHLLRTKRIPSCGLSVRFCMLRRGALTAGQHDQPTFQPAV